MAWAKGTIKLAAARTVFEGVEFEELKVADKVVGYRAKHIGGGHTEDTALTNLCKRLWQGSANICSHDDVVAQQVGGNAGPHDYGRAEYLCLDCDETRDTPFGSMAKQHTKVLAGAGHDED